MLSARKAGRRSFPDLSRIYFLQHARWRAPMLANAALTDSCSFLWLAIAPRRGPISLLSMKPAARGHVERPLMKAE